MRFGLLDMIGLAGTLVFALPVANVGAIRFFQGETLFGTALVAVAVAMVVLPQYFFDPARIVGGLFKGLLPRRLRRGADGDDAAGDEPHAER